jgi:hypothetical protein
MVNVRRVCRIFHDCSVSSQTSRVTAMLLNLSRVMAHCTTVQNFTAHQIAHSRTVAYVDYASTRAQMYACTGYACNSLQFSYTCYWVLQFTENFIILETVLSEKQTMNTTEKNTKIKNCENQTYLESHCGPPVCRITQAD